MPRTPLQFQQMKDERKLSILENALLLFAVHEKDSVSIDMICQKAKCSHGLAYHYFKNVDQIYEEIKRSNSYLELLASLEAFDLEKEIYSQLVNFVKKTTEAIKKSKTEVALMSLIITDESKKSLYSSLLKVVAKGQNEGSLTGGNPSDIVSTYYLFLKGIYQTYLNQKHPAIKVPSIDNIMQIFER